MFNIEITVKVKESKDSIKNKLINNGFVQTSDEHCDDIYLSNEIDKLNKDNILDILNRSVLIRHFYGPLRPERTLLSLKDKKYDGNMVTSEEIYTTKVDNTENTLKIFEKLGYKELICKKQYFNDFTKDDITFILEEVDDLGLMIEYENKKVFDNLTNDEILKIKENMYEEIKNYGILTEDDYDIKKANELIINKYNL